MINMIKSILVLLFIIIISACGTVQRFTEYKLVKGANEHGEPLNYYYPYKPYFRSIKVDNDYLSLCWSIIACPVVLVDYPISFVTDVVMLPADFSKDMYIHSYNKKHITQQKYGAFTVKSQILYGYNLSYLSIYYKDQQEPILLPTGYNLKIVEKKLNPAAKLLVETVKGHLYLIEDKNNRAVVSRVGNNSKLFATLPHFPEIQFFYRPIEEDNCSKIYCSFAFRRWSLPQACESIADLRNYTFTIGIDKQLNVINWDKNIVSHPMSESADFKQIYVLSISPNKEQAVYLEEENGMWVTNKVSKNFIILSKQQLAELTRLKEHFVNNNIEDMAYPMNITDNLHFIENRIALYKAYINWTERNFTWSLVDGVWQFKSIYD